MGWLRPCLPMPADWRSHRLIGILTSQLTSHIVHVRAADDADVRLSAVTLGGLQSGLEITRAQDAAKAAALQQWLDALQGQYAVLPMDGRTFRAWARLMHARSEALHEDAMIAATARVHGLTVVTRNVSDFHVSNVPLLNPFEAGRGR